MSTHQGETTDDEQRIRDFIAQHPAFSETALSLAHKLRVRPSVARRVLERLVNTGLLSRRTFELGIEPVYFRYPRPDG